MNEVFLILSDEPLDRRSLLLVDSKEKAKVIVESDSRFIGYQSVNLLSDEGIKDIVCDNKLSTMDNAAEFVAVHCMDCKCGYDEICPYI